MRIDQRGILLGTIVLNLLHCHGDIIFSQDFTAGNPTSQYVESPPDSHQFDILTWSKSTGGVVDGALQFTHSGSGSSWFARTTPLNPQPTAMIYSFDLTVSGNIQAQSETAVWQVGSGFVGTSAGKEVSTLVHSRFGIGFESSSGSYQLLNMSGGKSYISGGSTAITWVINNSGLDLSYVGPDNRTYTVANDSYDLWADTSEVFQNVHSPNPDRPLSNFKFSFDSGYGTIRQDNIVIRSVQPVPEPAATGFVAVGLLAVVVSGGIVRDRVRKARGAGGSAAVRQCGSAAVRQCGSATVRQFSSQDAKEL